MKLTMRAAALGKKITIITTAFVIAVSGLTSLVPFVLSHQAHALPGATVVTQGAMNGWQVVNQDPSHVTGSFVGGPAGSGLTGTGSYQVSSPTGTKLIAYNASTYGQKLNSLSQLSYSTYVTSRTAGTKVAPALDINAIVNGTWTTLVFEPTYTADSTTTGHWQSWNALSGKWWSTKDLKDSSNAVVVHAFNDFVPWSTITGLDANATVDGDGAIKGVQVVVGQNSGGSPWANFVGAFDNVDINGTVYDFEPTAPDAPVNLSIVRNGSAVASGSTVTASFMSGNTVLNFDAVPGADAYVTQVTYPGGSTQVWNGYHNTWLVSNGLPAQGQFAAHGDGTYTYTVKARDASTGLWSTWSSPVSLTYDTSGPALTVTNPTGATVSNTHDLVVTGTVSDPAGILDVYARANDSAVHPSRVFTGTATVTGNTWTMTIPAGTLQDGHVVTLQVYARDSLHNQSEKDVTFTVDNTAPTMDLRYGENGAVIASGSVLDNTGKNIRINKENTASIHVTKPNGTTWVGGVKPASYVGGKLSMDFLFTMDGTYTFYVEDEAGNVSPDYTVVIDTQAPTIQDVAVTPYTNHTITVSGTVTDPNLDYYRCNVYDAANHVALNGILNYYTRYYANVTNGQLCTIDVSALSDGTYNVRVVAYDKAGHSNVNGYTGYSFAVDTASPTVTVNGSDTPAAAYKTGDDINIHASDAVAYDHTDVVRTDAGATPTDHWTYTGEYFGLWWLGSGTYTVTAYDKAGNATQVTITIDNSMVATISPIATNKAKPAISGLLQYNVGGTPVANTDVVVAVDGTPYTTTTDADGFWTVTPTVANGPHAVAFSLAGDPTATALASASFITTLPTLTGPSSTQTSNPSDSDNGAPTNDPQNVVLPSAAGLAGSVLGASTTGSTGDTANTGAEDVKGDSTAKQPASAVDQLNNTDGSAFGLAWYWWLLIVAALAAIIWWIVAAIRNRQVEA